MTETTETTQEEPDASTADIITETAIGIAALSEIIGKMEFIEDDAEDGEDNPLTKEDQEFLAAANDAVEAAVMAIGYGNDVSRSQAIALMKELMDQYAGEERVCDDCRAKAH